MFLPCLLALAQPVQCGVGQGFQELGPGSFPKGWDSQRKLRIAFILLPQLGLHSRGHSPGIKEGTVSAEEHRAALTAEAQTGFPGIWLFNELLLTSVPHTPLAKPAVTHQAPEAASPNLMTSSPSDPGSPGVPSGTTPLPQCHPPA